MGMKEIAIENYIALTNICREARLAYNSKVASGLSTFHEHYDYGTFKECRRAYVIASARRLGITPSDFKRMAFEKHGEEVNI